MMTTIAMGDEFCLLGHEPPGPAPHGHGQRRLPLAAPDPERGGARVGCHVGGGFDLHDLARVPGATAVGAARHGPLCNSLEYANILRILGLRAGYCIYVKASN